MKTYTIQNGVFVYGDQWSLVVRGVTIHDATMRYVSRYKPHDTVYDTIHKTRYRLQQLRHLNKALALQNEKTKTEYIKKQYQGT